MRNITKISSIKLNNVYKVKDLQFNCTNYLKVTKINDDKIYGIFVNPENFSEIRMYDDKEHCYWDFNIKQGSMFFSVK